MKENDEEDEVRLDLAEEALPEVMEEDLLQEEFEDFDADSLELEIDLELVEDHVDESSSENGDGGSDTEESTAGEEKERSKKLPVAFAVELCCGGRVGIG